MNLTKVIFICFIKNLVHYIILESLVRMTKTNVENPRLHKDAGRN
jgi:hypothetical protein